MAHRVCGHATRNEEGQEIRLRILCIRTELLHPIDKGGKIRTYGTLRELMKHHHITYLTLDNGEADRQTVRRAQEYSHELIRVRHTPTKKFSPKFYLELVANLVSPLPYAMALYRAPEMEQRIRKLLYMKRKGFDLILCDFLFPDINVPRPHEIPSVLFQHNVEAMIWKRHTEVQRNPLKKLFFRNQWRKMERYERAACHQYDHVIAVSEDDAEAFREWYGLPSVSAVPTGVDTEFFSPSGDVERRPKNLVFVGSMDWMPNQDAVRWFAESMWPEIRKAEPTATFTIVGRRPPQFVQELCMRDNGIEVTGTVEDVRPYLERSAGAVVPLRVGGGTRLKIYEAMAMSRPTVSTAVGAEGLPVTDGDELFLADDPATFVERCLELLRDGERGDRMGLTAQDRVRRDFGWEAAARPFIETCERVAREGAAAAH